MAHTNKQDISKVKDIAKMPKRLKNQFLSLLSIQSSSQNEKLMFLYIVKYLERLKLPYEVDGSGNVIVVKGDATVKPCVCSHMDTVHDFEDDFCIYELDDANGHEYAYAMNDNDSVGVGGDDKNGVFACLYFLKELRNIKVIFFSREEVGLIGSGNIDLKHFKDVGYILQLDRWGNDDFICKTGRDKTVSKKALKKINPILDKYGYKQTGGLMTDSIKLFNRFVGVSCANISCGYYQHHSSEEFIDLNEFYHSLMFTLKLIKTLGNCCYRITKEKYIYKPSGRVSGFDGATNFGQGINNIWVMEGGKWIKKEQRGLTPALNIPKTNTVAPHISHTNPDTEAEEEQAEVADVLNETVVPDYIICDGCANQIYCSTNQIHPNGRGCFYEDDQDYKNW